MTTRTPSRIVDRNYNGWYLTSPTEYTTFDGHTRTARSYEDLAEYAPLRPVVTPTPADVEAIKAALRDAGRLAVGTLAAALTAASDAVAFDDASSPGAAGRALKAGRPGSWEADSLAYLALYVGANLEDSRVADGPRDALVEVLTRWITGPDSYVELAANLAGIVAEVADESGRDGWAAVADDGFRRAAGHDAETAYGLLYSQSLFFTP